MNDYRRMGLFEFLHGNPGFLFLLGIAVIVAVIGACFTVYEVVALYAPSATP